MTALLAVMIVIGAIFGVVLAPTAFRVLPTEIGRTAEVLDSLAHSPDVPSTVFLGNSIVMAGFDARQLGTDSMQHALAWNLGTAGQLLPESFLLADALPPRVTTVVLGVTSDVLAAGDSTIPMAKYAAFPLGGYQASATARRIVAENHALESLLQTPRWKAAIAARWVFRSAADLMVRRLVRSDIDMNRGLHDFLFPTPYGRRISDSALERLLTTVRRRESFTIAPSLQHLILGMRGLLRLRGSRLIIVVLPEHPRRQAMTSPTFYRELHDWTTQLAALGIPVLDLHDRLEATQFIDDMHPTPDGARALTASVNALLPRGAHFR